MQEITGNDGRYPGLRRCCLVGIEHRIVIIGDDVNLDIFCRCQFMSGPRFTALVGHFQGEFGLCPVGFRAVMGEFKGFKFGHRQGHGRCGNFLATINMAITVGIQKQRAKTVGIDIGNFDGQIATITGIRIGDRHLAANICRFGFGAGIVVNILGALAFIHTWCAINGRRMINRRDKVPADLPFCRGMVAGRVCRTLFDTIRCLQIITDNKFEAVSGGTGIGIDIAQLGRPITVCQQIRRQPVISGHINPTATAPIIILQFPVIGQIADLKEQIILAGFGVIFRFTTFIGNIGIRHAKGAFDHANRFPLGHIVQGAAGRLWRVIGGSRTQGKRAVNHL